MTDFVDIRQRANALLAKPFVPRPTMSEKSGVLGAGVLSAKGMNERLGFQPSGFAAADVVNYLDASRRQQNVSRLQRSLKDNSLSRNARKAAARALAQQQYPDADEKALQIATRLNLGQGNLLLDPARIQSRIQYRQTGPNPADPYAGVGDPRLTGTEDLERGIVASQRSRALNSNLGRVIEAYRSNDLGAAKTAMGLGMMGRGIGQVYTGIGQAADTLTGGGVSYALSTATDKAGNLLDQDTRNDIMGVFGQAALNSATMGTEMALTTLAGSARTAGGLARSVRKWAMETGTPKSEAIALGKQAAREYRPVMWADLLAEHTPDVAKGLAKANNIANYADLGMGFGQAGSIALDGTRSSEERRGAVLSAAVMGLLMTPAVAGKLLSIPGERRAAAAARLVPELEGVRPGALTDAVLNAVKGGADPRDVRMLLGQNLSRADFDARRVAQVGAKLSHESTLGMTVDPVTGKELGANEANYSLGKVTAREDASGTEITHEIDHRIEDLEGLGASTLREHLGPETWEAVRQSAYNDVVRRMRGRGKSEQAAIEYAKYYTSDEELPRYLIDAYMGSRGALKKMGAKGAGREGTSKLADLFDERGIRQHGGSRIDFDAAAAEGLAGGPNYDPIDRLRARNEGRVKEAEDRIAVNKTGGTADQRAAVGTPELVRGVHDGERFVGLTADELKRLDDLDVEHEAAVKKPYPTQQLADEARVKADEARVSARKKLLDEAKAREANDRREAVGQPRRENAPPNNSSHMEPKKVLGGVVVREGETETPKGDVLTVRTKVVDRSELVASHGTDFAPNPEYPSTAQPRDRSRAGARAKVEKIARELNPRRLTKDYGTTDRGAPVVGSDGVVESGNGRLIALDLAKTLNPDAHAAYVKAIREQHPEAAGIADPVLVHERVGPTDEATRRRFAEESNEGSSDKMDPIEQARMDANRLPGGIEERFELTGRTVEDSLQSPRNRELLTSFVESIPETERAEMFDGEGGYSLQAKSRFARALAARALGEGAADVLYRIHTEGDVLQRIVRGLEMSSSELLKMRAAADSGNEIAGQMGDAIVQALRYADEAREKMGGKAAEWFDQGNLTNLRDADAMRIGKMLVEAPNQEAAADLVRSLARAASDSDGGMFGDEMAFDSVRSAVDSLFGDNTIAPDVQRSISISSDELGENLADDALRKEAIVRLKAEFHDNEYTNEGDGTKIRVQKGLADGKWLGVHPADADFKRRMAPAVKDIIETMQFDRELPMVKPPTTYKGRIFQYWNRVKVGSEERMVKVLVTEGVGQRRWLYDMQTYPADHQPRNFNYVETPEVQVGKKNGASLADEQSGPGNADNIVPPDVQSSKSFGDPYYSRARGTVEEKAPNKARVGDIVSMLKGAGIKEEEIRTQLGSLLDDPKARITKEELMAYMDAHGVKVVETELGNSGLRVTGFGLSTAVLEDGKEIGRIRQTREGTYELVFRDEVIQTSDSYIPLAVKLNDMGLAQKGRSVAYGAYKLQSAGKNYTELLMKFPVEGKTFDQIAKEKGYGGWHSDLSPDQEKEIAAAYDAQKVKPGQEYQSSHWEGDPNVFAHVRFQEVPDVDGGKALLVEEIQSDWHQAGRKEGYRQKSYEVFNQKDGSTVAWYDTEAQAKAHAESDPGLDWDGPGSSKVPDAPFKKTWHELAFRRMVTWAADHGMKRLAWIPGQEAADRFSLSNHIDSLKVVEGNYEELPNLSGYWVTAMKDGAQVFDKRVTLKDLPGLIGEEMTDKALKQIEANKQREVPKYSADFQELDLRVGGDGMKGFYDKMLVDYANKYGKKYGVRVEPFTVKHQGGEVVAHSIQIPIEMANDAINGVPLWSKSFGGGDEPQPKKSIIGRILDAVSRGKVGRDDPSVTPASPVAQPDGASGKTEYKISTSSTEPSPMHDMGMPRRSEFELSREQQAQENIGEKARQSDIADRGETRGVTFEGKTFRNWDEARRLGSILNDRTDILKHLGKKDPGAGISDVERAAAMEELTDLGARMDELELKASEARDVGDEATASLHETMRDEAQARYAELAGKVMDLTSDNGRNLAATRMFVDSAAGDVQRQLRRARAEAKRQLKPEETWKITDAAKAVGALSEAVDKERARMVAEAEEALKAHRGKTITLADLGKKKQRSASGAVAAPSLDPIEALTRIAQNIAALGGVDPGALQTYARDRLGIHLDDDAAAELMRRGGERHANPKPETPTQEKLDTAKKKLVSVQEEVKQTTGAEFLTSLYRAGLLSTARAAQASIGGNAISRVLDDVSRVPAAMIDAALSLRTGERTVTTKGAIAGQRAAYSREAAKAALDAILKGSDSGELGKLDQPKKVDYKLSGGATEGPKVLLKPFDPVTQAVSWGINKVFDLLTAADRPARYGEMTRAFVEQATLDAMNKGLKGEAVRTYVRQKLGANPDPNTLMRAAMAQSDAKPGSLRDLVRRARAQADESVLAGDSPATKAAAAVGQIPILGPLFLPFPKIPTNQLARGLEWSPLGVVYGMARTIQTLHAGDLGAQKKAANALARGLLGSTALLYLGYKARELGYVSAPTSTDQGMRATEEAAGQQGSSVKVGNRWMSYRDVPQLMVFAMGAALYDAQQASKLQGKTWKKSDSANALLGAAADSAMDLPTLQGVQDATQALQEVSRAKGEGDDPIAALKDTRFVQGFGGSVVPKGAQDVMTASDPVQREATTFGERFTAGTPGRKSLPPRVDALGRPIPRTTGLLSQVRGLSPDQSERLNDPLSQELLRLRVPMTPVQRVRKEDRVDRDKTTADYAERKSRVGGALDSELRRLISSDWYKGATDKDRREEILAVRKEARGAVSADLKDERERKRK